MVTPINLTIVHLMILINNLNFPHDNHNIRHSNCKQLILKFNLTFWHFETNDEL